MLEVVGQSGVCDCAPGRLRAGHASGVLVSSRSELQARPDGSRKARSTTREFATTVPPDPLVPEASASPAAAMDRMSLTHGWLRAVMDATSARMQAEWSELAFAGLPTERGGRVGT